MPARDSKKWAGVSLTDAVGRMIEEYEKPVKVIAADIGKPYSNLCAAAEVIMRGTLLRHVCRVIVQKGKRRLRSGVNERLRQGFLNILDK